MKIISCMLVKSHLLLTRLLSIALLLSVNHLAVALSLSDAEHLAVKSDPAQQIYQSQQAALIAEGVASSTLPDPMIKVGMANVPTDNFELDQDPMTQLSVGVAQQFSRGSQRELAQEGFNQRSEISVFQALDRQLIVRKTVRELWFNILFIDQSTQIVNENKALFLGFYRDLQSKFSLGLAENEDLIAAEIEVGKFDEKLASLNQKSLNYRTLLSEYIGQNAYDKLPSDIPKWSETLSYVNTVKVRRDHYDLLSMHPKTKALTQSISVADNGIAFAQESYKPSFKVEVGYGHRFSEDAMGEPRSDLVSAFVSMDLPIFTDKRQDQQLISAQHNKGQKQAEQRLLLRQLNALLNSELINYQQIKERMARYQNSLLKQAKLHSKMLEESYQSNTRPFKEVIEAYIHEQSLTLEYQQLYFESLNLLAKIRYLQAL